MAGADDLSEGEQSVLTLHPHWKTVLMPHRDPDRPGPSHRGPAGRDPARQAGRPGADRGGCPGADHRDHVHAGPAAALAHHDLRADHPPVPAALRHPVPDRPRFPADPDQRRLVLARADRPGPRLWPARDRVGRRARAAGAERDPQRGKGAGHAVPARRGRAGQAGQGRPLAAFRRILRLMDGVIVRERIAGHPGVAELMLDRAEAMNAINTVMAVRLAQACAELAKDPQVQAIVLYGTGARAFSVGADLKERNRMSDADLLRQRPVFRAAFGGLLALPQPVIAAVHGYALGGGCELALCCDVIVADETSVFGLPETTVGLVPGGGGTQLATRRLGPGRAADLIFSGRRVDAAEAALIGLADRVVPRGTACPEAIEIAGRMAANSPVAVKAAKKAIRQGADADLAAALEVEDAAWRIAALSADRREGIAAFNEKRKPSWPGE